MSIRNAMARPLAAVAVAVAVAGFGIAGGSPAASAATPSAPTAVKASAVTPLFTTPYWGMNCSTWVSGSFGGYYGNASCTGAGKWRVTVSCTAGFSYSSIWYVNWPDQTQTASAGSCYWGVNSVTVEESAR